MADSSPMLSLVVRELCALMPELDAAALRASSVLRELGASSIDVADLLQGCLEQTGLDLPMKAFAGAHTLGEIARVLEARTPGSPP